MKSQQAAPGKRVSEETRFLFVKVPVRIVYRRLSPIVTRRKYISTYLSIAHKSRRDKSEATKPIATRIPRFHQCDRLNLPSPLFSRLPSAAARWEPHRKHEKRWGTIFGSRMDTMEKMFNCPAEACRVVPRVRVRL